MTEFFSNGTAYWSKFQEFFEENFVFWGPQGKILKLEKNTFWWDSRKDPNLESYKRNFV